MKKVALITGGSRGIGREIVNLFREHGYEVYDPSRREMDLNDNNSILNYCHQMPECVDVVVNNAGINTIATLEKLSDTILDEMVQINLKAPLKIVQCLQNKIGVRTQGKIVNISSVWSTVSKEGRIGYTATKTAINGITRTLALEFSDKNVMVNSVAPGFVDTELTRQNNTPGEIEKIAATIPIGRLAAPQEIAELVFFLASDKNSYITGQTIFIDGGYYYLAPKMRILPVK